MQSWLIREGVGEAAVLPLAACALLPGMERLLAPLKERAASVLVMTVPYRAAGAGEGNLAAFAALPDYHRSFASLFASLRKRIGPVFLGGFADHSPFAEVETAARAGLGVRGDNGLLLTKPWGSYVLIGEAVLSADADDAARLFGLQAVTPSEPASCDHCGACRRACPGGCLPGADRAGCLSAVTQKKGELTEAEAEAVQKARWAWGCDACQTACPRNRAGRLAGANRFTCPVQPDITETELAAMPEEAFRARAFGWRPRQVLARNLRLQQKGEGHD